MAARPDVTPDGRAMPMTTRCPHCGTAFKVVADQLRVRSGLVRCGVCSRVFDGFSAIVEDPSGAAGPVSRAPGHAASSRIDGNGGHAPAVVVPPGGAASTSPVLSVPAAPSPPPSVPRSDFADEQSSPAAPRREPPGLPPQRDPAVLRGRDTRAGPSGDRAEPVVPSIAPSDSRAPVSPEDPLSRDSALQDPAIRHSGLGNVRPSQSGPRATTIPPPHEDSEEEWASYREPYAGYRPEDAGMPDQPARAPRPAAGDRFPFFAHREDVQENRDYVSVQGEARTRYDDTVDAGMAPPVFMDEEIQRRRSLIGRSWVVACLVGVLVLAIQWAYVYRTAIASDVPALRPALEAVCAQIGCQVGYARRLERISITASSLQPPSGAAGSNVDVNRMRLVLRVTLRNRYDKPQPWPALVLQLTDLSDTVVVRKVLMPDDYLPAGQRGPFPPGGERSISVPLQVAGLQVNGYQLDKFFP